MRELERDSSEDTPACSRLAIVGRGRLGTALAEALRAREIDVAGPLGRGDVAGPLGSGALTATPGQEAASRPPDAILLCVPDAEIASAARAINPGPLVGHCSGATGLEPLEPHEAFSLHPLMTVNGRSATDFAGAGAAIDGSTTRALELARHLARTLGMQPVEVAAEDRVAYHAAASIASNFLITLEAAAEELATTAGIQRAQLVPLVRAAVESWAALGPSDALTGPVARGDEETVARQREAVAERTPELLELFDALVTATRRLAQEREPELV